MKTLIGYPLAPPPGLRSFVKPKVCRWQNALTLLVSLSMFAIAAQAQEGTYEVAIKKVEQKKQSRWSLGDWLMQKEKNRRMDLWLVANSQSSIYESFLEGRSLNYGSSEAATPDSVTNQNAYSGTIAAYAGIAGLRVSYEKDQERRQAWAGSFNLRIFGRALQDTHLNFEYGLQGNTLARVTPTEPGEFFQNQFGGVTLDLYLTKNFGIEGVYRKILPAESEQKRFLDGESSQVGVFIDFGIMRIFGDWRKDLQHIQGGGMAESRETREGFGGGLRLFF